MTVSNLRSMEGQLTARDGLKVAIVASRFNSFIVERLIEGAMDALRRHGVEEGNVTVIRVPGAWEMAPVVERLAAGGKVDGVIAVGAVIRGATPHFDYIANEVAKGLAQTGLRHTKVPVAFGVLTTDTIEQAIERAGTKAGNKGFDAAMSMLEMCSLHDALDSAGF